MANYNGWTNHATWEFMNWYEDDLQEIVENNVIESEERLIKTEIYDLVESYLDEQMEFVDDVIDVNNGFIWNILNSMFQDIDIDDITETLYLGYTYES